MAEQTKKSQKPKSIVLPIIALVISVIVAVFCGLFLISACRLGFVSMIILLGGGIVGCTIICIIVIRKILQVPMPNSEKVENNKIHVNGGCIVKPVKISSPASTLWAILVAVVVSIIIIVVRVCIDINSYYKLTQTTNVQGHLGPGNFITYSLICGFIIIITTIVSLIIMAARYANPIKVLRVIINKKKVLNFSIVALNIGDILGGIQVDNPFKIEGKTKDSITIAVSKGVAIAGENRQTDTNNTAGSFTLTKGQNVTLTTISTNNEETINFAIMEV